MWGGGDFQHPKNNFPKTNIYICPTADKIPMLLLYINNRNLNSKIIKYSARLNGLFIPREKISNLRSV